MASASSLLVVVAVALTALFVVAVPRFGALGETGNSATYTLTTGGGREIEGLTVDMREYLRGTEYYGGHGSAPQLAPFTYRLGVPWLAGQLPFDSVLALNVVVLAALAVGLVALVLTERRLLCSSIAILVSALAYSVSFPVFYWGSFNYVDGAIVGSLALVLLSLAYAKPAGALVVLAAAVLVKEWALVAVPVIVAWIWLGPKVRSRWLWISGTLAAGAVGLVCARLFAPDAAEVYNPWLPSPSEVSHYLSWNLSRSGPLAQFALSALPVVAALAIALRAHRTSGLGLERRMAGALVVGVVSAVLLATWALFAAQFDGRSIWTAYPFALTLGAVALSSGRDSVRLRSGSPGSAPADRLGPPSG